MRKDKLKDMIRSILPSTSRRYARCAKAERKRHARRSVRIDLRSENLEVDLRRDAYLSDIVGGRRGADKLNHFMRWCEAITEGMSTQQALDHVRAILPASLIGDHAYGHWESYRKRRREGARWLGYWERGSRRIQSYVDSTTFRLRRAMAVDPNFHACLNAEIKRRKAAGEPRRLLAGVHDVATFVLAVARSIHAEAQYWRVGMPDPFGVERQTTLELLEKLERQKGGRKAAFLFLPQQRVDRRVVVGQHRVAA